MAGPPWRGRRCCWAPAAGRTVLCHRVRRRPQARRWSERGWHGSGRALLGSGPLARDGSPAWSGRRSPQEAGSDSHARWGQSGRSRPVPPGPVSVRCWASRMPPAGQRAAGHSTPPRPESDLVVVASILLIQGLSKPRRSRLCRGPECRAGVCHLCWAREGTAVDVPRGLGGHRAAPEPAARSSPRSHVPLTSGPRTRLRADATPEGPRLVTERSRRRVNDRWREGRVPLP